MAPGETKSRTASVWQIGLSSQTTAAQAKTPLRGVFAWDCFPVEFK